eukprot:2757170-Rhodomonas_salina.1
MDTPNSFGKKFCNRWLVSVGGSPTLLHDGTSTLPCSTSSTEYLQRGFWCSSHQPKSLALARALGRGPAANLKP